MSIWERTDAIPDMELWRTHNQRRERLVLFVRKRLKQQMKRRGANVSELQWVDEILDPKALTIGFARRFATYKRANLLFQDLERLKKIICNQDKPLQLIIAGKAHPQDKPAKEIIKEIIHILQQEPFRTHIAFIEDYDINVARYLVQGVDVWLNTPIRPLEASGTSGMKAAMNGALNLSILDGWWDEGQNPDNGWAIGNRLPIENDEERNLVESRSLYNCIENEVVPLFYKHDNNGIPRFWIKRMKAAIRELGSQFSTHRMLREYVEKLYIPANEGYIRFHADHGKYAKEFAEWRQMILDEWKGVSIVKSAIEGSNLKVGDYIPVSVDVNLGKLSPRDVLVEVMSGRLDSNDELQGEIVYTTQHQGDSGHGTHTFSINVPCEESGQHGLAVRVRPNHPDMVRPFATDCVCWE
jgi:starch phosphorylase